MQQSHPHTEKKDGRLRPYVISIDWLQMSVRLTQHFVADDTNMWGFSSKRKAIGSKVWKDIFEVYDEEGIMIGTLACHPHSEAIRQDAGTLKFENDLLYEENAIDRAFAAIKFLGLEYRGITRIDIAYDCNELYNGLKIESLIKGYLDRKYIKRGQNKWMLVGNSNYYGVGRGDDVQLLNQKPEYLKTKAEKAADRKKRAEQVNLNKEVGIPIDDDDVRELFEVPTYSIGSITWGFRSNAIQVQIYDKSRELREVKFKKHIWQTWINAGLDVKRPVYRLEIRIQNQGKHVVNLRTGKAFVISALDVITQEQLEQMYFDYAEKYLCFHHNKGDERHKERMPRLQILSLCNQPVMRPKRSVFGKDYTRGTKIALNQLNKEIVANKQLENNVAQALKEARDYLERSYELHLQQTKWMREDLHKIFGDDPRFKEVTPEVYFERRLAGAPEAVAKNAAEAEAFLESQLTDIAARLAVEQGKFSALDHAQKKVVTLFDTPTIRELIEEHNPNITNP